MRDPHTPDCSIKACSRAAGRGGLCSKHRALVPEKMIMDGMCEGLYAAHMIAKKWHRKQQRYVQQLVREEKAA